MIDNQREPPARESWETTLIGQLPLLGHRNWIVIADSAYPEHSSPGVETVIAGGDPLNVVQRVIERIASHRHLQVNVYEDLELAFVDESDAPGVTRYRQGLAELFKHLEPCLLSHEEIISKIEDRARLFHVLVIKTELMIPYTSIFLELGCGYWTKDAEKRLRTAMKLRGIPR